MSFVNWVIDSLASEDVIDLYFILSDLVDVNLSEDLDRQRVHNARLGSGAENTPPPWG